MATGARDRISALPEEILQHILSFLPLKSAAQTSVLSKRWKTLWTYTLVLDFGSDAQLPDSPEPYISVIKRCLNLHKSKTLQKFQIHFFPGRKYSSLLDDWIRFAAKKGVKELDLELYPDGSQEVEEEEEEDEAVYDDAGGLPSSLFQSQSLSTLKLRCCVLNPPVKGFTGLKYLRTLELVRVSIWDKGLSRLVSNCRLLETLCICACRRLTNLKVCGADLSLKNLLVLGCRRLGLVEIYAPNLELFEFDGNNFSKLDLKNVASLREVGLFLKKRGFRRFNSDFREFQADFRKFLADISHVEVLNVGSWFLPYIFFECFVYEHKPMVFQNLKELHFYGASLNRCTVLALVSFLSGSPSLTEVDINLKYDCVLHPSNDFDDYQSPLRYENEFRVDGEKYWAAKGEQRFVGLDYQLQCLEIFKLKGFTGHECEMMLLKFTLERAVVLKSLVIMTERECDIKAKKEILQRRIAEFPAASSRGRVEISEPSMGDFGMRHRKMLKHLRLL